MNQALLLCSQKKAYDTNDSYANTGNTLSDQFTPDRIYQV